MNKIGGMWIPDECEEILEEAARYRALDDSTRFKQLAALCKSGMRLVRSREDAQVALNYRDPYPTSYLDALRRLQAAYSGPPQSRDNE